MHDNDCGNDAVLIQNKGRESSTWFCVLRIEETCSHKTLCINKNIRKKCKLLILSNEHTMLSSLGAHFLKICRDNPACNIPGVANTTIGPGLSIKALSNG